MSFGGAALAPTAVQAANVAIDQCNAIGAGPGGATTGMDCSIDVVNTISNGATSSTVTLTRLCSLDPCAGGNGTFVTSSSDLVTTVDQCNGSGNDAAHPNTCDVTIVNNISADTPGAQPVTSATVNQCVGSGEGGGGSVSCDPFPATTTNATVTQCNGSANGGGATVTCTVGTASTISSAVPVRVNQCNGTGNPGGALVTCSVSITTNITAAVVNDDVATEPDASPAAEAADVPAADTDSTPDSDGPPDDGLVTDRTALPPQVELVPSGGIQAGAGSSRVTSQAGLIVTGLVLVLAAVALGGLALRPRRQDY